MEETRPPLDVYHAPSANLVKEGLNQNPRFYIVSLRKFWILFVATFSFYTLYWFYKHWSNYRVYTRVKLWPVARAVFPVFFTHSLFQKIDNAVKESEANHTWSPMAMASLYILATLFDMFSNLLTETRFSFPYDDFLFLVFIPFSGWALHNGQKAANLACADPSGQSNDQLTAINLIWIFAFGLAWLVLLIGLGVIYTNSVV